ncbi:MAG TPA: hypothetical protein VFC93_20060 [Chloroflexota bacterium]|nr:hypothetical protein [Chloroflexota bacterium]
MLPLLRLGRTAARRGDTELAAFLHQSEPLLRRVTAVRHAWVRELDQLVAEADRRGSLPPPLDLATLGRVYADRFAELRARLVGLPAPPAAEPYRDALRDWLDSLIRAAQALSAARVGSVADALARCRSELAAGRPPRQRALAWRAEHGLDGGAAARPRAA